MPGTKRGMAKELKTRARKRHLVLVPPDALEALCRRIENRQIARSDPEIGCVQMQFAALDQNLHARKRHQIVERRQRRLLLQRRHIILERTLAARSALFPARRAPPPPI